MYEQLFSIFTLFFIIFLFNIGVVYFITKFFFKDLFNVEIKTDKDLNDWLKYNKL